MKLLEFTMSGTAHSSGYKLLKSQLKAGDEVVFERDPHNAYDTGAIKVLYLDQQIGWVPKRLGEAKMILDRLLDCEDFLVEARVVIHEPENPVDMQCVVEVELLSFVE